MSRNNKDLVRFVLVMILLSLPELFAYYCTVSQTVPMVVQRVSMLLTFSIFIYFDKKSLNHSTNRFFMAVFVLMYIVSIFHITPKMPVFSLICISILMVSGVTSKHFTVDFISKGFTYISILYTILVVWQISKMDIDISALLRRGYTWTEAFAYGGISSIWLIPLFSSYLNDKKGMWAAIALIVADVVLNSIMLKRAVFVDVFIASLILLYVSGKLKDKLMLKRMLMIGIPLLLGAIYYLANSSISDEITQVSDAINDRFSETGDDLSTFDRFIESKNYFSREATIIDILIGRGFLSVHHGLQVEAYFLHVGWGNWIFKGGLLLFFPILFLEIKAFGILRRARYYTRETLFSAMYCAFYAFEFFYGDLMGFGPHLFFYFYCLMQVANPTRNQFEDAIIEKSISRAN